MDNSFEETAHCAVIDNEQYEECETAEPEQSHEEARGNGLASGQMDGGFSRSRRFGRPISFIWEVFTAASEPWKLRQSDCLHCKKTISYHKKSEYVLVHLNRCAAFLKYCKEENKMELMYFVIRHMEEASRAKRLRRRNEKIEKMGGVVAAPNDTAESFQKQCWQTLDLVECSPAPECIPERLLRETALELLSADDKELGPASFLYKDSCGFFAKALAPFLKKCSGRRNVNPDLIIPVGGVEDALNLVITMQLKSNHFRPGGFVFVEERTQLWACDLFLERGLCVRTVASDRNGIIINDLSMQLGALSSLQNQIGCPWNTNPPWPLFLYILPSFNNPTGICLSPGRRLELLELTSNAGLLVVSDDTFALLDYSWEIKMLQIKDRHKVYGHYPGAANPIGALGADKEHELIPLVDFAEFKNVLSVSSFSKVIAPDLAVGWIEATDRGLLDTLSGMAFEISGGSMSHFTACIIAQCLKKDHAEGEEAVAAKIMKLPDLYRHLCDVKNTYAKRYHHLTSALIRFSNALLPPGEANQIHIEGFSDYPDGHVDNVFQFSNSSSYAISHFDKNGVLTAAFERKRIFNSISYVDDIATEDANGRPRFLKTNPQWKNRTGGYFIWVRLPVWVTPRPAFQPIFPVDAPRTTAPQFNQHPNNNFFLMDQMVLGPPSLQWFIEKARTEFSLDFKLDIECTPFGPSVSCSSYSYDSIHGLPCMPVTPFGSAGLRWNYVRMCFVRYDEAALEQAAERFVALLAKIYTECVSVPYYGY